MTRAGTASAPRLSGGFRRLWAASAISNLGDGVRAAALPLLATEVTSDPRLIAGVVVAERLPWLVLILPGGVWADRYDRRTLRVRLDVLRATVMVLLAVLVATDSASMIAIFLIAATLSGAESIVDSASTALVPALVDEEQLERAGGLLWSAELIGDSLIGPALGGLLFAAALALPFGFDAATFAVAAVLAASIPGNFRPDRDPAAPQTTFRRELAEGIRWLWQQRLLRNLALISSVLGFGSMMQTAIFVIFAREQLGLGPIGFGLLLVFPAIGGVTGSLLAPRLRHLPLASVLSLAVAVSGAAVAAIATTDLPLVVGVLTAAESVCILIWNVLTLALRQRLIPDVLLGRVGASYRFVVYATMPFGALAGGLITDRFSASTVFVVAGGAYLVAAPFVYVAARSAPPNDG